MNKRIISGLIGLMLASGTALATDKPFTGTFQGDGRQCSGKLIVRAKTIEWRTPFAKCKKTPYTVLTQNLNASKPEIVFLLEKSRACDFGVISMYAKPDDQDYWHVLGYRSAEDYQKKSDAFLGCRVEKLNQ